MCQNCTTNLNDPIISQVAPSLSPSLEKEKLNARKGMLLEGGLILAGHFDITQYNFLKNDPPCPASAHPNLWEHAKVNMITGLFRVNNIDANKESDAEALRTGKKFSVKTGDVFQIRGYDISNMTLMYGDTGWIVMDVLTVKETAQKAWELVKTRLIDKPVKAVVYSHSHTDHYGGMDGIRDAFAGGCLILAPEGFTKHAVSENIYVGTAMQRRAFYQFGHMLPPGAEGQIDAGLGKITAKGQISLIPPTEELGFVSYVPGKNYVEKVIDGITLQFQLTPGTEAPAEMNVYAPKYKVLFIAENCTGTLHNTLTPRGAQVRDALQWANYIDQTIITFGDLQSVCSSHNWPHFTNADCIAYMELQRDLYRYIHNATLHLVNLGYTIDEVGRMLSDPTVIPMPAELENEWCNHGFYGTVNHDAKAVYQRYLGWYDGNPAHLNRPMPADLATEYVKAFGADAILRSANAAINAGNDEWAMELFNHLLYADPNLTKAVIVEAKKQYICVLKKAGFKSEGATWRNMYLTGAGELQAGLPPSAVFTLDDNTISAMSLEMILQFMGIMLQSCNVVASAYSCNMNITLTDQSSSQTGQIALVKVSRGVLHYRIITASGLQAQPDITVKGLKKDFFRSFIDKDETALAKIVAGTEIAAARKFISYLTQFKIDFPIMTPRPVYKEENSMKNIGMTKIEAYSMPSNSFLQGDSHVFVVDEPTRTMVWYNGGGGWSDSRPKTLVAETKAYIEWLCDFVPPGYDFSKCGITFGENGICHTIANRVLSIGNSAADAKKAAGDECAVFFFGKYGYGLETYKRLIKESYDRMAKQYIFPSNALSSVLERVNNYLPDELLAWRFIAINKIGMDVDALMNRDPVGGYHEVSRRLQAYINAREALYAQFVAGVFNLPTFRKKIKEEILKHSLSYLDFLESIRYITKAQKDLYYSNLQSFLSAFIRGIEMQTAAFQSGKLF